MTTQPIIKSFSPELQAAARRHSVGNEGYPFDALQVGQAFELPLDTVDLRHLRSRITANNKTGKNFFHVVVRAKNTVEVGRLPDAEKPVDPSTAALIAYVKAESNYGSLRTDPVTSEPKTGRISSKQTLQPADPPSMPSFITSTPVNDLPETGMTPWATASVAKQAPSPAQTHAFVPAPVAAPALAPFPAYTQAAPAGFAGIPATLLHLTAATAHDAHVKEQYRRFGVTSFDEMTDEQIVQANADIEDADAAWEASNVKPAKFPDTSKMSFDAKKTKPTQQAPRTPEQLAKHNNRPIMSDEEQAAMAKLASDAQARWYAEKAAEGKNPQPPKILSW